MPFSPREEKKTLEIQKNPKSMSICAVININKYRNQRIFTISQAVIVKIVVSKILTFFGYIYIWAAGLYSGLRAAVNDKTSCCTIIDSCSQPRVYSSQARWTRNYEAFASSSLLTFVISTFTSGLRYTFSGMLQSRVLRPFHLSG